MQRRAPLLLTLLAVGLACAGSSPAFLGDPEQFKLRVQYVALLPLQPRLPLVHSSEQLRSIESELQHQLEAAGYRVLPPEHGRAIRQRMLGEVKRAGGGPLGADALAVVEDYSIRELLDEHGVDALIKPYLVVSSAELRGPVARWDGTRQRMLRMRDRLAVGALRGSVPGLSLLVVITSRSGEPLYAQRSGIELLARFGLQGEGFHRVPEGELWQDPERLRTAVERALEPLAELNGH